MYLVIDIELISGRYDAAGALDRKVPEWPPHPARIFSALVASARSELDRKALRWLESLPYPIVQASPQRHEIKRQSFVVTNKNASQGGSQFYPARTNMLKSLPSVIPDSLQVRLVWPDIQADVEIVKLLDDLARRVPYIGRSTGIATLSVTARTESNPPSLPNGLVEFHPDPNGKDGTPLRIPYPNYLQDLIDQFKYDRPAWEVYQLANYRLKRLEEDEAPSEAPVRMKPSVYRDLIILRFVGIRPDGRLTTMLTEALRAAVMSATKDPLPQALHGHGPGGSPHVAFLALPDVGHIHADGHLLGMAVAIPNLPYDELRRIVQGILLGMATHSPSSNTNQRTLQFTVPRIGDVSLTYKPGLYKPWGLTPERWKCASRKWVSATPVVLDRYPRKGDIETEIIRSCLTVGLPEPTEVRISKAPLVRGAIKMQPNDLPLRTRGKLFRHIELHFSQPVSGPVLLGAGRYLGIGLMVPSSAPTNDNGREQ
jgi:CRISPR-associated protein Csb2